VKRFGRGLMSGTTHLLEANEEKKKNLCQKNSSAEYKEVK
jgi:hypothetical protein